MSGHTVANGRVGVEIGDGTQRVLGGLDIPSVAVGAWVCIGLLVGGMPLGGGLYISQLLLLALCFAVLLHQCFHGKFRRSVGALLTVLVFVLWVLLIGAQVNARFIPESLKLLLLIASAMLFSDFVTWKQVRIVAAMIPWVASIILACVWIVGVGDYFGYGEEGRFGVPWWGSPNSTGFVIAIVMACVLFGPRLHASRSESRRRAIAGRSIRAATMLGLGTFLVMTESQGGLLCAGVVVLRFVGFRIRTIFGLMAAFALGVVLALWIIPSFELPELVGSGRLEIWTTLLTDLFGRGATAWLFGVGPGAIDLTPWFTARVLSAHSMFVEVLYSFGLIGLLIMLAGIWSCFLALSAMDRQDPRRAFLEAMLGTIVVGFFFDTYLLGAQLTWLGALLLSWAGLSRRIAAAA